SFRRRRRLLNGRSSTIAACSRRVNIARSPVSEPQHNRCGRDVMFTSEQTTRSRYVGFNMGTTDAPCGVGSWFPFGLPAGAFEHRNPFDPGETMEPDDMPNDVLIVEDDPIIALDFEDTILGFGVKTVRTAASVAKALDMIADRPPDFALLDVGLIR